MVYFRYDKKSRERDMALMESFTQDQWDKAKEILEAGSFEDVAYSLVGVCKSAWLAWKRAARQIRSDLEEGKRTEGSLDANERRLLDFLSMVEMARKTAVYNHVKNIKAAGALPDKWQASAWYLERTLPEQFGRKDSLKLKGAIAHANLGLTAEEEAEFKANFAEMFPGLIKGRAEDDGIGPSAEPDQDA